MIDTLKMPRPDYLHKTNTTPTSKPIKQEVTCDECEAILSYESISDTHVGEFGARYITCPFCNNEILTNEEGITITANNLEEEYFSDLSNGVDIDFKQVKTWIKNGVRFLEQEPDENYYYSCSGNTFVCIFRSDGSECDYYVIWCPDGYKDVELRQRF